MKSKITNWVILIVAGNLLVMFWALSGLSSSEPQVAVVFKGRETGVRNAAAFEVTNRGPIALILHQVEVEQKTDSGWMLITNMRPSFSHRLAGKPNPNMFSPLVEPGEIKTVVVPWPTQSPWRVTIDYGVEKNGLSAFPRRLQMAWRDKSLTNWGKGRIFIPHKPPISTEAIVPPT